MKNTNLKNYFEQEKENFHSSEKHFQSILNKIPNKNFLAPVPEKKWYLNYFYLVPAFATAAFLFSFSFLFDNPVTEELSLENTIATSMSDTGKTTLEQEENIYASAKKQASKDSQDKNISARNIPSAAAVSMQEVDSKTELNMVLDSVNINENINVYEEI